ncbi:hypothetical protein C6H70_30575, partial [Klebsiella pneumoniae]
HLISSSHTVSLTEAPLPPALLNATSGKWLGSQQKRRPGSAQAALDASQLPLTGPSYPFIYALPLC